MTAQHDSNSGANAERGLGAVAPSAPVPARRRILMRGAAAALPTILTLRSGAAAAVARSSNVISEAIGGPSDRVYNCLGEDAARGGIIKGTSTVPTRYDLGDKPSGDYVQILERDYYVGADASTPISEKTMCETSGEFLYKEGSDGDWQTFKVNNKGMLVSATALSSFAGSLLLRNDNSI